MEIFTPLLYLFIAVLLFFFMLGLLRAWRRFFFWPRRRTDLRVVEFDGSSDTLKEVLTSFKPPFSIEVAVHQIGKQVHNYIVVPSAYLKKAIRVSGGKEVKDYNIYHPGGSNLGYSLTIEGNASPSLESFLSMIKGLDFSNVNEIGEGAMFQLILGEKPNGKIFVGHARVLASAPTKRQVEEIINGLHKGIAGYEWREEKEESFIDTATYRELGTSNATSWAV